MLIGITGKAGSGKDTAFSFIKAWADAEGRPVRRDAFADRLKISAARALGYSGTNEDAIAFCNDLKTDKLVGFFTQNTASGEPYRGPFDHPMAFITGREYLQYYGTEAHRDIFGYDFWISAVISQYEPDEILVITDVRFDNEAQAVRDAGGEVWEILRSDSVDDDHVSEQPISPGLIDEVIGNFGSLDHLRDLVQSRIERTVYA